MESSQQGSSRKRLLDVSARLFRELGFHATSMRDIARAAGMRPASIYHHFDSKEAILRELMWGFLVELLSSARDAAARAHDARGRLGAIMRTHIRLHATKATLAFVADTELRALQGVAQQEILMLRDRYEELLQDVLRHGVEEGTMHLGDVKLASYQLLAMGTGVVFWWRPEGRLSLEAVVDQYVEAALRMCGIAT